jgi:surfactin synthase thioesterase subunit
MDRLVSYVLDELQLLLNPGEKFGLLGHSLGGMLAYKSAVRMEQAGLAEPSHLFVSGVLPPHAARSYVIDHGLQADDLIDELVRLGGIPAEVLAYPELLRLSLPVIRSDLQAHNGALLPEELRSGEQEVVKCDMTVFYGRSDPLTAGDMEEWRRYAGKACRIEAFEGGHFFIQDKETQVTEMIASILRNA